MRYPIRDFIRAHIDDPALLGGFLETFATEARRAAHFSMRPMNRARLLAQAEAAEYVITHYQTQTDNDR